VEGDRTIYVVDDDAGVRRSLEQLLNAEGFAVMSFASAAAFLDVAPRLLPGCVLLDIRMPEMDGLELHVRLRDLGVALPVVIMTGHGDVPMAVKSMKAGAVDFLEKPYSDTDLLGAIETALRRGGSEGDRDVIEAARLIASLSPREREVLDALTSGRPNKLIAFDLGISVRTVEVHRSRMMRRLGVRQFAEAVRIAVLATRLAPGGRPDSAANS
jgi:FixJ family two-component response regulator